MGSSAVAGRYRRCDADRVRKGISRSSGFPWPIDDEDLAALDLLPGLLSTFEWQTERMRNSISSEMLATDRALDMARDGIPFRDAYKTASAEAAEISDEGITQSLANRVSPGGCGQLETVLLKSRLEALRN